MFHYSRLLEPVDEGASDRKDFPNEWQLTRVHIANGDANEEGSQTLPLRIEK